MVRYFLAEENIETYNEELIARSNMTIIPRKDEFLYISSKLYKVKEIYYCSEYKTNNGKDTEIDLIDIYVTEVVDEESN